MVVLEACRVEKEGVQQQSKAGKCVLEDLDQVHVETKDRLAREAQLVLSSLCRPLAILH